MNLINRQDAIDALLEMLDVDYLDGYKYLEILKHLPSAERKGKWIERDDGWNGVYYVCSCCKETFTLIDGTPSENLYNYCPNCRADMRGEEDE